MKINWGIGTDMTRRACGTAVALLLLVLAPAAWSQQYFLYSPTAIGPEDKVPAKDGVLVREMLVQKGDTLSGLSRRFSGHGSYYSQILLFNDIRDPDLIYAGKTIRVPVSKGQVDEKTSMAPTPRKKKAAYPVAAVGKGQAVTPLTPAKKSVSGKTATEPTTEISLSDLKRIDAGKQKKREARKPKAALVRKSAPVAEAPFAAAPVAEELRPTGVEAASGQKLFERAVKSYKQEDCRVALELFERFLSENPNSPLAADASLYKAECYLKLSSQ